MKDELEIFREADKKHKIAILLYKKGYDTGELSEVEKLLINIKKGDI